MNTTLHSEPVTDAIGVAAPRIVSIDVFRGLTMAVMIFVNALFDVHGLPWWTYHAPARVDVMTYVDMVFPFFLFAVGLSLPFAIDRRLSRNPSQPDLWLHILLRSVSLVILGLILANAAKADRGQVGIKGSLWALLGLLLASLFLLDYRPFKRLQPYSRVLQILGVIGVAVLFAVYRRTTRSGHEAWIDFSYPEILGLIGFSYFSSALLYIPTRRWKWASAFWFVSLLTFCALTTARIIVLPEWASLYLWPFGNGSSACIVMAGVVTTCFFREKADAISPRRSILYAWVFGCLSLAVGWMLIPLGISKIRATPTWCLWSIGAAAIGFAVLYWICDVRQWRRWAGPFQPAGSNTLTTYLLPDLWDLLLACFGLTFWDTHFAHGWPGIAKTLVFTCAMLAIAGVLTRARLRLQL